MLTAWQAIADGTREEHQRFLSACADTARTQFECLMDILATNAASEFGKRVGFASLKTIDDFRRRVPLCRYEDLINDIDAQTRGSAQLCAEPVRFFERTGGSTGGGKLIPFTASALRGVQRAIEPWLADLVANRPGITQGVSYWSISPAAQVKSETLNGTPIGSASDLAFLRAELQPAFAATLATPADIATLTRIDDWRLLTLLSLLTQENLRLISVWSPSFLGALLEALADHFDVLQSLLRDSSSQADLPPAVLTLLRSATDRRAASERLSLAFAGGRLNTHVLWPRLDTISCWAHGPAAGPARELGALFPDVYLQAKGLLATEGVVSIPLCSVAMPLLAVRSGFFEFIDEHDRCYLAQEVEPGKTYRVVMTTYSGFYRYDLGDTVRAHGCYNGAPLLEFIGRQGVISDICGEKLSDAFVSQCLDLAGVNGFALLAPVGHGYCLFVDSQLYANHELAGLASRLESQLADNPQYDYARQLRQLAPLQIVRVIRPAARHTDRQSSLGRRLGDIKPSALCLDAELAADFLRQSPSLPP